MRSVSAVAVMSGPMVLSGYGVASIAATWTSANRRIHEPGVAPPKTPPADLVLEAFLAVTLSTVAWWVIEEVSPGSGFSRIGYLSDQVLAVWHSVALWTGLAAVAGLAAPIFHRFQGSRGLAATAALLLIHYPWFLLAGIAAAGVALAFGRTDRDVQVAAIAVLLPVAWVAWVLAWQSPWGLTPGPEATVWVMVLTVVLGTRWWADRFIPVDEPF